MKSFFTKKIITPAIALLFILVSIGGTWGVIFLLQNEKHAPFTTEEYYTQAVKDAMTIESDEILPVVKITKDNELVTMNENNEVLLITWHKYPDSYIAGQDVTLQYGAVWTFTDQEMIEWYGENKNGVEDWELRFEQLLGLPTEKEYTHFTALWVPVDSIKRPAYTYDITTDIQDTAFEEDADQTYIQWFDENILDSYFNAEYPWTRLGYTYDWADNGTEYGLSEFLIEKDAVATVKFTYSTQEFLNWLEQQ